MKRMFLAVAVLGISLGLGACAGSKEAQRDVENAVPGLSEAATGVVTNVSGDTVSVRTTDKNQEVQFHRSSKTELVENGKPFNWTDLTEGTPVRVKYEPEEGAEKASKIEVLTGKDAEDVLSKTGSSGSWSRPNSGSGSSGSSTSPSGPSGSDDSMDHGTMDHEQSGPMGGTTEPDSGAGDDGDSL